MISRSLKIRVNRYIDIILSRTDKLVSRKEVTLMKMLSGPLQEELQLEVYWRHARHHPFFRTMGLRSMLVFRKICFSAMDQVLLSRGDVLFAAGETAHLMFFIIK